MVSVVWPLSVTVKLLVLLSLRSEQRGQDKNLAVKFSFFFCLLPSSWSGLPAEAQRQLSEQGVEEEVRDTDQRWHSVLSRQRQCESLKR